jgi:hypothetical protein
VVAALSSRKGYG